MLVSDLDLDGDLELFCGSGDGLSVYDIKDFGGHSPQSSIFRSNFKRDGYYKRNNLGDINQDYNVDVFDIILVVNYITDVVDFIDFETSDLNSDGLVNVNDIILIINIILEG